MKVSNFFELNVRVYIAGILMPCSSISISTAINAPPSATMSLPPDARLFGIGRYDRVPVQIFARNTFGSSKPSDYILLFDGEIVAYGYSSTAIGREVSVNARSTMNFLGDVRIRLLNELMDYAQATLPAEGVATAGVTSSGLTFPASLILQGIAPVKDSKIIKTPFEFVDNIGKYLDGLNSGSYENLKSEVAKFYGKYADLIRFRNRYPKVPYYDESQPWAGKCFPTLKGLQDSSVLGLLKGILQEQNVGTLMSFLNSIANNMEYEINFPNAPKYDNGKLYSMIFKPLLYDAFPPACNIMYRSHVESVQMSEQIYGSPTRIRVRDMVGPIGLLSQGEKSYLKEYGMMDYYPSKFEDSASIPSDSDARKNFFALELRDIENYTGPYLYDTAAPKWFSYVVINDKSNFKEYKLRTLEHMFRIKRYESRNINVSMAFNPYITAGFPGVAFDSFQTEGAGFIFTGHVVSVTHSISKGSASTSVTMSFCRTLEEELADPMLHGMDEVAGVNHNKDKVGKIYQRILGCGAVSHSDITGSEKAHGDPLEAYSSNLREICTLKEYLSFIGTSLTKDNGAELVGKYFSDRKNKNLQSSLKEVAVESGINKIYR